MEYYKLSRYLETGEYHLFRGEKLSYQNKVYYESDSVCGAVQNRNCEDEYDGLDLTEDEMAISCANQENSVRHQICANCVKYFYKTDEE